MSESSDAFASIVAGYRFGWTTEGEYVIIPTDTDRPQVAEPLEAGVYDWMFLLDQVGVNLYGRGQVVLDMAKAHARQVARFAEPVRVATRLHQYAGSDGEPRVLVDLGDRHVGKMIHISPRGWFVYNPIDEGGPFESAPLWHRDASFQRLPEPGRPDGVAPGAGKAWLREVLALNDRDWDLTWLWLISTYFPHWTQQGLMFVASTQMGKSLRSSMLLRFLHPADPDLGGIGGDFPTTERAWGSLMHQSPILAFDDVESISPSQHQAMKQVITGASFRTQKLYETRGTTTTTGKRPLLITASGTPAGFRDDLRNRIWTVSPTRPPLGDRLNAQFEEWSPAIFADLLDDIVTALRGLPESLDAMDALLAAGEPVRPREIRALAHSLDRATGSSYEASMLAERRDTLQAAAEEDRFSRVVYEFVKQHPEGGELSNDALLQALRDIAEDLYGLDSAALDRANWFPSDTGRMGSWLGRKADSLGSVGVHFHLRRGTRGVRLRSWDPLPDAPAPEAPARPDFHMDLNTATGPLAGPIFQETTE